MLRSDKRIRSIRLKEVGPFEDCAITFPVNKNSDLAEVHIFTGGNGSGKSTLLYCLACNFERTANISNPKHPYYEMSQRRRQGRGTVEFGFRIPNDESDRTDWEWHKLDDHDKDWQKKEFNLLPIAYNGQRPFARDFGNKLAIQEITESPLANHLVFGHSIDPNQVTQWIANVLAKEAFALKDNNPTKANNFRYALDRLIQAINDIAGGDLSFKLDTTTLNVKVVWRGDELAIDVLPDGLKSIISFIADILMRMDRLPWADTTANVLDQPLILFLDEIDIHLHPQWQRKVLPTVQKLFRNAQIFVSTHSPFVVGSVSDAWVYRLDEAQGKGTSEQPFEIQPIPSGAGSSYEVLIEEVFGISEHFDVESQRLYADLKTERNKLLGDPLAPDAEFKRLAQELAQRSEELEGIVSLELRQLKKQGRVIELAAPPAPLQEESNGQV